MIPSIEFTSCDRGDGTCVEISSDCSVAVFGSGALVLDSGLKLGKRSTTAIISNSSTVLIPSPPLAVSAAVRCWLVRKLYMNDSRSPDGIAWNLSHEWLLVNIQVFNVSVDVFFRNRLSESQELERRPS